MLRGLRRLRLALLIAALLLFATNAVAVAASTPPHTKTTIVRVEDKDDGGGVNATTLLESAVSGIVALAGVGIGVGANRKLERGKVAREECARQIAEIDALVDRVTAVTNRLPTFVSGNAEEADVLGLQADVSAVLDARNRVQDPSVRGAVDVFAAAAQSIIREPRKGTALTDQAKVATGAKEMVSARSEEAKDALCAEGASSKRARAKRKSA